MTAPDPWALVNGQRVDPATGLVFPWFTWPALDAIDKWDLSDKTVLEWGGGASTFWWANRCRRVITHETDPAWHAEIAKRIAANAVGNADLSLYCPYSLADYLAAPCAPDIAVVDGSDRTRCIEYALALPRPLVLIVDNWQQDGVYVCAEADAMMDPYISVGEFYIHLGYVNPTGEGLNRPWMTAIWRLP